MPPRRSRWRGRSSRGAPVVARGYHRELSLLRRELDAAGEIRAAAWGRLSPRRIIIKQAHAKNLRGLRRQLEENPREDRREDGATLPYRIHGKTYHLPVTAYVFMGRAGQTGARRNFVAHDHAVVFTSNGQVHHHWRAEDLPYRTKLNRLLDRLFAVVETDELPIEI